MLFSEEKKLRIDLTKRITEANLDKERLAQMENLLLQGKSNRNSNHWWYIVYQTVTSEIEKQKFTLQNAIKLLLAEATNGHISDDDVKVWLLY